MLTQIKCNSMPTSVYRDDAGILYVHWQDLCFGLGINASDRKSAESAFKNIEHTSDIKHIDGAWYISEYELYAVLKRKASKQLFNKFSYWLKNTAVPFSRSLRDIHPSNKNSEVGWLNQCLIKMQKDGIERFILNRHGMTAEIINDEYHDLLDRKLEPRRQKKISAR